jgi:predicted RNA binding protein YcfA (HicA-like mRNA interferase family)
MGRMAQIVAARMIRALGRLGWERDRQRGSHVVLTKGGLAITVPLHAVLKEGTARGILKQAGVTEDEFFAEY